jgi:hypothetical protein
MATDKCIMYCMNGMYVIKKKKVGIKKKKMNKKFLVIKTVDPDKLKKFWIWIRTKSMRI